MWETVANPKHTTGQGLTFPENIVKQVQLAIAADEFDPKTVFVDAKDYIFSVLAARLVPPYKAYGKVSKNVVTNQSFMDFCRENGGTISTGCRTNRK